MIKYIYSIIICTLTSVASFGQNLVPNADFENYKNLPCGWSTTSDEFSNYVNDWYSPTITSTDFHSTLCSNDCWANPILPSGQESCRIGTQKPHSGNNMAGLYTMVGNHTWHEYLQIKLSKPLIPGQQYYVEMWVSAGDNVSMATNNLGMYFSKEAVTGDNMIAAAPQFNYTKVVTEKDGWVMISGNFLADNDGQYLTIGNFFTDEQTTKESLNMHFCSDGAYYYIDDIAVVLCPA